ncbi:hypothetical protein SERLADRAFT_436429 [Serpula lacrymans var. lacrymans S7.9]|uniref:MFS general substrate transporter n=1 Tax=Serpula lacrymans var. lacrymans (strain S7.9) TaxID=578457 RepID=F8NQL3_SERL9|nr:uncharacterized protein SERLADRAFT_436429 [Serpula lacrymans var. lacrymans S7.9]EGO26619.1 hypothetical protein SERLADRAFT_436429 [Serpula lacrymans var. lacrymans S7.9]
MTGFSAIPIAERDLPDDDSQWAGEPKILGPRWANLPTLTVGLLGVQVFWSVEMSYASPYLLSLGLTKSWMAIVFLAGPLSGLIMQPLIGVLADNSKSRFGRRRPFLLVGSVLCSLAMLLLGYTRPIATLFTNSNTSANDTLTIWFAVLAIYCIDFSINAGGRSGLLVDTLPTAKQASGNAWAARMLGIGSVAGFFVGNIDLPRLFPFFGTKQLEVLAVIASLLLISAHILTSYFVKEKVLLSSSVAAKGFRSEIRVLWNSLFTLPRAIRQICIIQFFAWLAWFPVLFYTTVYIGELHKRSSPVPENDDAALVLDAEATRLGSRALFYSSVVSLVANVILPFFVTEAGRTSTALSPVATRGAWTRYIQVHLSSLWASSHLVFAIASRSSSADCATFIMATTGFSWAVTQWAPFSLLAEAILSHPMVDDAGLIHLADTRSSRRLHAENDETQQLIESQPQDDDDTFSRSSSPELERTTPQSILRNSRARLSRVDVDSAVEFMQHDQDGFEADILNRKSSGDLSSQAGVILGIHNMFIVVPQFLVTGISSIIFAIFEPDKSILHGHHPGSTTAANNTVQAASPDSTSGNLFLRQEETDIPNTGPNSVAIIFRIGGVAAAIAFVLCWRLARELKHK